MVRIEMSPGRAVRSVTRVAATTAAASATLVLAAIAALPLFGMRAMTVTSGSMEPTIGVGATVVIEEVEADLIEPGDIITYAGGSTGGATTHRVLSLHRIDGALYFRTQGDANDTPDVDLASAEVVIGRAWFDVPHLGRALAWSQQPAVRFATLGAVSAWMLVVNAVALRRTLRERSRPAVGPPMVVVLILCVTVVTATELASNPTSASLTDTVAVTENRFVTGNW